MTSVVILQPQYFPWLGVFEQIASSDIFVHFDDVQLPRGRSFCTRVQIKTGQGVQWLSVPSVRHLGQTILATRTDESTDWRRRHVAILAAAFTGYKYRDDALDIVKAAYAVDDDRLAEINIRALESMARYMGLAPVFMRSSQLETAGAKDDLLLSILRDLRTTTYISGMGGLKYIDHDKFERLGIAVEYMRYGCKEYAQAHGPFTPFVTALDAVAACGPRVAELLCGRTQTWQDALEATREPREARS